MASSSKIYTSTDLIEAIKAGDDYVSIVQKIEEDKSSLNTMDSQEKPALVHALSRYKKTQDPQSAAIIITLLENNASQTHQQVKADFEELRKTKNILHMIWDSLFNLPANIQKSAFDQLISLQQRCPSFQVKAKWLFQLGSYNNSYQMHNFAKSLSHNENHDAAISKFEKSISLQLATSPPEIETTYMLGIVRRSLEEIVRRGKEPNTRFKACMALSRTHIKADGKNRNTEYNPQQSLHYLKQAKEILNTNKEALAHTALIEYHKLSACLDESTALHHYACAAKLGDTQSAFLGFDFAVLCKNGPWQETFIELAVKNAFATRCENTIEEVLTLIPVNDEMIKNERQKMTETKELKNEIPKISFDNVATKFNNLETTLSTKIPPKKTIAESEFKASEPDASSIEQLRRKWENSIKAHEEDQAKLYGQQMFELIIHLNRKNETNHFHLITSIYSDPMLIKAQQELIQSYLLQIIKKHQIENDKFHSSFFVLALIKRYHAETTGLQLSKENLNICCNLILDNLYQDILRLDTQKVLDNQIRILVERKIDNIDDKVHQKAKKLLKYTEDKNELCHDAHVLNSLPALLHLEHRLTVKKHDSGKEKICGRIYVCTKICFLLLTRSAQSLQDEYSYAREKIDSFIKQNQDFLKLCMEGNKDLFVGRVESDKNECIEFAKWCNSFVEGVKGRKDLQSHAPDVLLLKSSSTANEVVKRRLQTGRKTAGIKVSWLDTALGLWSSKPSTMPKQTQSMELKAL